ncbi:MULTISPECIES: TonB-dependent receptor domain-containing protein [unclassified Sphingomonas]|uniref:TonB-dependent receptor domain-containing protein n=1 Tax=unclassified Sphingomonas TaxID=196159 RepID=UPI0009E84538|nr:MULTISPECIES: TonB-dependent receptor [unclassified Sphingomonas]
MKASHSATNGLIRGSRLRAAAAALAWSSAGTVLAIGLAVPAQAQVSSSLRGKVTAEGGVSQVTVVNVDTGFTRTVTPTADGGYQFASLPPGTYRLEVTTPSGVRRTDEFRLAVAQNAVFDFDLSAPQVASADGGDEIIITGGRIRSMQGGEVGTTVSQRLIEQLPQNNRNFLAFADLAPGVQFITNGSDQSRLQGGAQNSNTVNIFIDGVGQKDYVLKNGITGQDSTQGNPFPQSAIAEYRVISSNYKAEFDQVSSVAITAVTKSGTNQFEGSGFVDFTNQDLRDPTPNEILRPGATGKIRTRDLQFGGTLGGPIIKDMLHFFASYEGKRRLTPRTVTFPSTLSSGQSLLPASLAGNYGEYNEEFNENLYFGKLTFTPTDSDLFEFSGKYRDETGEQFNSGIAAYETRTLARVKEIRGLGRWEHTGEGWINDFKVAYEDVTWNPRPATQANRNVYRIRIPNPANPAQFLDGNVLETGGGTNFQDKGQKGWQISNDFTYTGLEGHTFKAGVKAKWVTLNSLQLNGFNPVFRYFTPLGSTTLNTTTPYQMSFQALAGGFTDAQLRSKNFQLGLYIQDDWDVTDRLTVNLGLRWDYEETPAFLNYVHSAAQVAAVQPANYPNLVGANYNINDYISTGKERKAFTGAFQPRFGFNYKIDEAGRFAIFGGFGRSYDRTQFDFIQQELAQGSAAGRTFNFIVPGDTVNVCTPSATCIPYNPVYQTEAGRAALIAGLPAGAGRELRFIKNDLKTPYSDQYSLGLRGDFGLLNAEIGYSHVESRDGFVYLLGNRRPGGLFFPATGAPDSPFGFPPSPFGSIIIGDNGLETNADTVFAKLIKRYTAASPWSIDATYTYTKANENRQFGEVFSLDYSSIDEYPFRPSAGVRSHRFVMAGTVDIPYGITLATKFQIASPVWLKRFVTTPGVGVPGTKDIVAIEAAGNGDKWGFRQLDLSATKEFKLGFINDNTRVWFRIDIINLMNDRNYNGFNSTTGLRDPNNYGIDGPPRTVKVSTGFNF